MYLAFIILSVNSNYGSLYLTKHRMYRLVFRRRGCYNKKRVSGLLMEAGGILRMGDMII